jgi:hypothetical protein
MWQIHGFKMQMIIWGQTSIPEDHDTPPIQSKSLPVSNNNDLRSMPKALQKIIYELTNTENTYTDCLRYRSRTAIGDGDPLDNVEHQQMKSSMMRYERVGMLGWVMKRNKQQCRRIQDANSKPACIVN